LKYYIHRTDTDEYRVTGSDQWLPKNRAYGWRTREAAQKCVDQLANKTYFKYVEILDEEDPSDESCMPTMTEEEADILYSKLVDGANALTKLDEIIFIYEAAISKYDSMTSDLLHRIELGNIGGVIGVRLVRQLKDTRIKRRKAKDKVEYCLDLRQGISPEDVSKALDKYNKVMANRTYRPRELPEIFDNKEAKK